MTTVNTGENGTFDGYAIQTTNGRIAGHAVPVIYLDACLYHKIKFAGQSIDNSDDTVKLLKNGTTIYQTPVINDTGDDGRFCVNLDMAAVCDSLRDVGHEPMTEAEKDRRIRKLKAENAELKAAISVLQEALADILNILNGLLGL